MKNSFTMTLLSIVMAACTQPREMGVEPGLDFLLTTRQLRSLPELPHDLSKIQCVEILDTIREATEADPYEAHSGRHVRVDYCHSIVDYISKTKMVSLACPENVCLNPYELKCDGDRLFVSYQARDANGNTSGHTLGVAIYNRDGKLVSRIGEQDQPSTFWRMVLNTKKKEICLMNSMQQEPYRSLCYDYQGNYLRTDYHSACTDGYFNIQGRWIAYTYTEGPNGNDVPCYVVYDDSLRATHRATIVTDRPGVDKHVNIGDDLLAYVGDTVWQILPDRVVARYVYSGDGLAMSPAYTARSKNDKSALKNNLVTFNGTLNIGNSRFLHSVFGKPYVGTDGNPGIENAFGHFFDSKTRRSFSYRLRSYNDYLHAKRKLTYAEWLITQDANWSLSTMLPDGTLVFAIGAYDAKQQLAHLLAVPKNERMAIVSPADEKRVRQMGLNDLLLVFVCPKCAEKR